MMNNNLENEVVKLRKFLDEMSQELEPKKYKEQMNKLTTLDPAANQKENHIAKLKELQRRGIDLMQELGAEKVLGADFTRHLDRPPINPLRSRLAPEPSSEDVPSSRLGFDDESMVYGCDECWASY